MKKSSVLIYLLIFCVSVAFASDTASAEGGGGIFQQLGIDFQLLIVQIVGFVLLIWLMNMFLFKPIGALLERRKLDVVETYDKIEADKVEMQSMKAEYEKRISDIEAEARDKIQAAIKEAQSMKDHIIEEARTQAKQIHQSTVDELDRERHRVLIELRQQVADMTIQASEKLIGANLDSAINRKLIQDFIEQVEVKS